MNEDRWYQQLEDQYYEDQDSNPELEEKIREEDAEHDWEEEDDR